ncbi:MAG: hypothetical protein Q7S60_02535, partial [bacterium]|nr:hypothetical protein [bacterium]
PSAPSLSSPGNGSTIVSSPATLTFSHNGNFGTSCVGGSNRLKVYAGVGSPSSVVCDLPPGSTSCQTNVSNGQNYQWKVQATNGALTADSGTSAFSVLFNSGGWFQVQDSDVTSPGDLISKIPLTCTGSCVPQFGLSGGGGYPGVPAYGGSNADFGGGSVSLKEWLANTKYSGRRYDYAWFARLAPTGVFTNEESVITDSQISGGDLVSGFQSGGYFWRYKNGDLTINSTANLGDRKVILFVNGNLTIQGKINLDDGKGFFAAIAAGNINIDPGVSQPNNPALEGMFMANGTISTGTKSPNPDDRLYIRGALVGWGGINLQRDLDPNKTSGANNLNAAEYVEYAPDLILTFPRELLREGIVWKEVAP